MWTNLSCISRAFPMIFPGKKLFFLGSLCLSIWFSIQLGHVRTHSQNALNSTDDNLQPNSVWYFFITKKRLCAFCDKNREKSLKQKQHNLLQKYSHTLLQYCSLIIPSNTDYIMCTMYATWVVYQFIFHIFLVVVILSYTEERKEKNRNMINIWTWIILSDPESMIKKKYPNSLICCVLIFFIDTYWHIKNMTQKYRCELNNFYKMWKKTKIS